MESCYARHFTGLHCQSSYESRTRLTSSLIFWPKSAACCLRAGDNASVMASARRSTESSLNGMLHISPKQILFVLAESYGSGPAPEAATMAPCHG